MITIKRMLLAGAVLGLSGCIAYPHYPVGVGIGYAPAYYGGGYGGGYYGGGGYNRGFYGHGGYGHGGGFGGGRHFGHGR